MEEILSDLMAVVTHKPLAKRLSIGVTVKTHRGYGVIAEVINITEQRVPTVVVELDGGERACFSAKQLQVVEHVDG